MKSKYILWIIGLMSLVSCKDLTCDFYCTPSQPYAGQMVTFSNLSTGADDYRWSFGDNASSEESTPSHIYKKAGSYTVTLRVIRNKVESKSVTHTVTVLDTVPSIAINQDSICTYQPIKLSVRLYNPWDKDLAYQWQLPNDAVVLKGQSLDSNTVVCYFTEEHNSADIHLDLTMGSKVIPLQYTQPIYRTPAPSVLLCKGTDIYEQCYYTISNQRVYHAPVPVNDAESQRLIQAEQDTIYYYGDSTLTCALLSRKIGHTVKGFQVDRLLGKCYAYGDGLWVVNINGEHPQVLNHDQVQSIKVDVIGNRLYWSTPQGVFAHSLVTLHNNACVYQPNPISDISEVSIISVNSKIH